MDDKCSSPPCVKCMNFDGETRCAYDNMCYFIINDPTSIAFCPLFMPKDNETGGCSG